MPIAIVLRRDLAVNIFRDSLISALDSGDITEAVIASGFFQEGRGDYFASLEPGFASALIAHNVVLHCVGVYSGHWYPEFKEFVANLKTAGVNVQGWKKSGFHWHAKIAVLLKGNTPMFAIVGSSNMTSRAFGVGSSGAYPSQIVAPSKFNFECDTMLWLDGKSRLAGGLDDLLGRANHAPSVIRAPYVPAMNSGITLEARLAGLLGEIYGSGITPT